MLQIAGWKESVTVVKVQATFYIVRYTPVAIFSLSTHVNLHVTCFPAISYNLCFPGGSDGKVSACNAGDLGVQFLFWEDPLEKAMAPHSSSLAWKIPWTEEPGRLQSMVLQRVGHD